MPPAEATRRRLIAYYSHYNPTALNRVDEILEVYAGEEEQLFADLHQQYGPEPADTTASGNMDADGMPVWHGETYHSRRNSRVGGGPTLPAEQQDGPVSSGAELSLSPEDAERERRRLQQQQQQRRDRASSSPPSHFSNSLRLGSWRSSTPSGGDGASGGGGMGAARRGDPSWLHDDPADRDYNRRAARSSGAAAGGTVIPRSGLGAVPSMHTAGGDASPSANRRTPHRSGTLVSLRSPYGTPPELERDPSRFVDPRVSEEAAERMYHMAVEAAVDRELLHGGTATFDNVAAIQKSLSGRASRNYHYDASLGFQTAAAETAARQNRALPLGVVASAGGEDGDVGEQEDDPRDDAAVPTGAAASPERYYQGYDRRLAQAEAADRKARTMTSAIRYDPHTGEPLPPPGVSPVAATTTRATSRGGATWSTTSPAVWRGADASLRHYEGSPQRRALPSGQQHSAASPSSALWLQPTASPQRAHPPAANSRGGIGPTSTPGQPRQPSVSVGGTGAWTAVECEVTRARGWLSPPPPNGGEPVFVGFSEEDDRRHAAKVRAAKRDAFDAAHGLDKTFTQQQPHQQTREFAPSDAPAAASPGAIFGSPQHHQRPPAGAASAANTSSTGAGYAAVPHHEPQAAASPSAVFGPPEHHRRAGPLIGVETTTVAPSSTGRPLPEGTTATRVGGSAPAADSGAARLLMPALEDVAASSAGAAQNPESLAVAASPSSPAAQQTKDSRLAAQEQRRAEMADVLGSEASVAAVAEDSAAADPSSSSHSAKPPPSRTGGGHDDPTSRQSSTRTAGHHQQQDPWQHPDDAAETPEWLSASPVGAPASQQQQTAPVKVAGMRDDNAPPVASNPRQLGGPTWAADGGHAPIAGSPSAAASTAGAQEQAPSAASPPGGPFAARRATKEVSDAFEPYNHSAGAHAPDAQQQQPTHAAQGSAATESTRWPAGGSSRDSDLDALGGGGDAARRSRVSFDLPRQQQEEEERRRRHSTTTRAEREELIDDALGPSPSSSPSATHARANSGPPAEAPVAVAGPDEEHSAVGQPSPAAASRTAKQPHASNPHDGDDYDYPRVESEYTTTDFDDVTPLPDAAASTPGQPAQRGRGSSLRQTSSGAGASSWDTAPRRSTPPPPQQQQALGPSVGQHQQPAVPARAAGPAEDEDPWA